MKLLVTTFIFAVLINQHNTAKILGVFPSPSISHHAVFRPLTQELSKRGHEVVVITADPAFKDGMTPPNFKEIDIHNMSYTKWEKFYEISSKGITSVTGMFEIVLSLFNNIIEDMFKMSEVKTLIKEEQFDLIFLEAHVRPILVCSHVFNAPVIQVSSFGSMDFNVKNLGASWHPIVYPSPLNNKIYNLTKWEKIKNLWDHYHNENVFELDEPTENAMLKRIFGPNTPTIKELSNKIDMLFLNIHPLWEGNRPVPPNVIYIWGIHEKPQQELPKDLKNYLDSSKNGIIYMSLGTNLKTSLLPPNKVQIIVKVFSQLPYNIIWKWDQDELPGRTENIRIFKWLPQSDLLRHPNIKLFITQGGIQSTGEAITGGVPLIGIPMLGDQWFNVEKYVHHKIGLRIDLNTLQEEQLKNAIETVIHDPSYRQNIVHLRDVMQDQPMKPLERAVWWTEHVLRHGGGSHLRTPAANMPWTEYLEIDIIFIILSVLLIVISLSLTLIYTIYKYFRIINLRNKVKKT